MMELTARPTCKICGNTVKRIGNTCCSRSCANTNFRTKPKIKKHCPTCGMSFDVLESKNAKYCSRSCAYKGPVFSSRDNSVERPCISLNHGKVALVDDEDFDELSQYTWGAHYYPKKDVWRAQRFGMQMHRQILGVSDPKVIVDHRNGDTLDNRKVNLRICTSAENSRNRKRPRRGNLSRLHGVSWSHGEWHAVIMVDAKQISIGRFNDKKKAAIARDSAAICLHGDFASLNFPELVFWCAM